MRCAPPPPSGRDRLHGSYDVNSPPPKRPTVSCQRYWPQESMAAEGARRSTGNKGARRKLLSTLHPNTILNPNPDPNAHPNPQPSPSSNPRLWLELV